MTKHNKVSKWRSIQLSENCVTPLTIKIITVNKPKLSSDNPVTYFTKRDTFKMASKIGIKHPINPMTQYHGRKCILNSCDKS
jgi:hypothetical protein